MASPLILCIDYGKAKVGLAIGSLIPSTPLQVIRYQSQVELINQLLRQIQLEQPEALLFGWPADHLDQATPATPAIQQLAQQLHQQTSLPIMFHPETLTTKKAMSAMIKQGVSQKKRRLMEDSFAAAAILDDYLLTHE